MEHISKDFRLTVQFGRVVVTLDFAYLLPVNGTEGFVVSDLTRMLGGTFAVWSGRLLLYHLNCCYWLREKPSDHILVHIPQSYNNAKVSQGSRFELEPIFSYKGQEFIDGRDTGLWVLAFTEGFVCICAAFFPFMASTLSCTSLCTQSIFPVRWVFPWK